MRRLFGGLRDGFRGWRDSRFRLLRLLHASAHRLLAQGRLLASPRLRAERRLARYGKAAYQRSSFTLPDRYPELFAAARAHLGDSPAHRILSFGCSSGEEVVTLGRHFAQARVTGVDINDWCLRQCRRRRLGARFTFLHRQSAAFAASQPFDIIFCLAVFQRTEHRQGAITASHMDFADFEREIAMLDALLKPGGLLIIDHSDFRFSDTACGAGYSPLLFAGSRIERPERAIFAADGRRLPGCFNEERVFIKPFATAGAASG